MNQEKKFTPQHEKGLEVSVVYGFVNRDLCQGLLQISISFFNIDHGSARCF